MSDSKQQANSRGLRFAVVVYSAPWSRQGSLTAYRFCRAALAAGHQIERLFFYCDGVHNSSTLAVPAQDDFDIPAAWQALVAEHEIDAISCVSSSLKRGVINAEEAGRHERGGSNLSPAMALSGLGQLVEAASRVDRVVSFGA